MLPSPDALHPMIRSLFDYWQKIHPETGLPGRQHFNPADIASLLANVWLVDVETDPNRFFYRVVGSALIEAGTPTAQNQWLDVSVPDPAQRANMEAFLGKTVESRAPNWRRGEPTIMHNRHISELEVIALPMARDGSTVDQLLCATVFYWRSPQG